MLFERLITRFATADRQTRLEALLDASRRLPDLPERFHVARDAGAALVPECQTPVSLFVEREAGTIRLYADVPREAPTVGGYVSLLVRTLDGATPAQVAEVPDDLLDRLGLVEALGMMRIQGLTAVLRRLKRMVLETPPG